MAMEARMGITLRSEGAAMEVTGSKHILEVDGARYLIDCGAFQGKREECDRKNRACVTDPANFQSVILTHAHYDHCGLLPLLSKRGYQGNIYSTPATRDLANLIMMDSAKIQSRDAEFLSKQAAKKGKPFDWKPLFDEDDVLKATSQFVTAAYNRPLFVGDGVKLEFFDAGHILGSAIAYLTLSRPGGESLRVAFTGDLGRADKPIIKDPDPIPPAEYIVLESTYGDRLHEAQDDAVEKLARVVGETVARGGKVLIPAFAIERTQELIFYLHILVDQKRIPQVPIWVDSPMAINATSIFQIHQECYDRETHDAFIAHHKNPFGFNELHYSSSVEESKRLNDLEGPAIIISADGMCEAGRIQHHLVHGIGDSRNTVLIVGFMAEQTLGRAIKDGRKEVKIFGDLYQVRAKVEEINAFSAHADYSEIWEWLSMLDLSRLKKIFLVHGEREAQAHLTEYLKAKGIKEIESMAYGDVKALA
jgi:metallo-beta-lactamase family protein